MEDLFKKVAYCENKQSVFYHHGCTGYDYWQDYIEVPENIRAEL